LGYGVVHLVFARFGHGGEVLGDFLDDGDEDEAFEFFGEVPVEDYVLCYVALVIEASSVEKDLGIGNGRCV
jgi:hypothetical protein